MHSSVALVLVATIVLVQCQGDWVSRYRNVREMLKPSSGVQNSLSPKAFRPPRYQNLFGERSQKVTGESFAPQSIGDITGKVNNLRRHLFSWQAPRNTDFFRR
ncbi:hypothetical protein V3C99_014243 [Haemonchus contortus]